MTSPVTPAVLTAPILEILDLRYRYKSEWGGKPFEALKGITASVRHGEAFGFLGHNGAGKTTTIKCVLGLVHPSSGVVRIDGKPSSDARSRARVGYLPEQPYFYDHLTVNETLSLYGRLAGIPRSGLGASVDRALARVKLSARGGAKMRTLSKGLTQRVAMAQAIMNQPALLILDEPFSGLDPIGRKEFRDLLFELKSEGTAIFMSSHILDDVEYLCDTASIMSGGELKGTFAIRNLAEVVPGAFELVLEPGLALDAFERAYGAIPREGSGLAKLRIDSEEDAYEKLRIAVGNDVKIHSFGYVHGKLEDLFVRLVQFDEGGGAAK